MTDLYRLRIHNPDDDSYYEFGVSPAIDAEDVERIHRRGVYPSQLGAVVQRLTFQCAIDAATPAALLTVLSDFLSDHINRRVLPEYVKIVDTAEASVVPLEIDSSDVANNWEELEIVGLRIPGIGDPSPSQLVAGVEFSLVIQGRKVFPDENGVWFLDKQYEVEGNEAGLQVLKLETTVKISEQAWAAGTTIPGLVSTLTAALSAPPGWVRVPPANNTTGVHIRYTRSPTQTEAVLTSVVQKLPTGQSLSTGASGGNLQTTTVEDLRTGLTTTRLDAFQVGGSDPLGDIEARNPDPSSLAVTSIDRLENRASGSFETRAAANGFLAGKVSACRTQWTLSGGRRRVEAIELRGNLPPILDDGPYEAWVLQEVSTVTVLGATVLADAPLPLPLPAERWRLGPVSDSPPRPVVYAGGAPQHVWERTVTRIYYWLGGGDPPLENAEVQAEFMSQFLQGVPNRRSLGDQVDGS